MKFFYLTGAIVFTVLILITGFENLQGTCNFLAFLFTKLDPGLSPAFLVFGVAMMGAFAGAMYFGLVQSLLYGEKEEEE